VKFITVLNHTILLIDSSNGSENCNHIHRENTRELKPSTLSSSLAVIARYRKAFGMANLLEEIEGAITDEIDQENDPRARAGGWPIDGSRGHPQAYHHYGPHSAIFGNDIAYQQRGPNACYDSGYGHHAGSSSSYSQRESFLLLVCSFVRLTVVMRLLATVDSPSPATLRNPQEAVICQPPVSLGMMPPPYSVLQPTSTYTAAGASWHLCF
jgi:hypothetical protein